MDEVCEVCGQTEFTAEGGFYYCVECGTKSQHHGQELVDEFQDGLPSQGGAVVNIKKYKKSKKMITSWEQYNYILLGYVDRLVSIGAGENFKLTVLQLWTAYLRRMEVAFFDKEKPEKPRLHVFHKKSDAEIIYNRRKKKPPQKARRPRAAEQSVSKDHSSDVTSTGMTAINRRRAARKARVNQKGLMNAEYETFIASQKSDVSRSLHDLSVRSLNASRSGADSDGTDKAGQRIKYSRLARIRMKRKLRMSTDHIDRHERDVDGEMSCHTFQSGEGLGPAGYGTYKQPKIRWRHPENLTRLMVSSILSLGLNVSGSDLQLADLVRFHREDHISHTNLLQFLPEELDPSCYTETLNDFQRGLSISHYDLRLAVVQMNRFLHVEPITPDLNKLCKRYLDELCLPAELIVYVERLMALFPPKMKFNWGYVLPNYEGRAMAYIVFVLKLLFGINDKTEDKMSKSATKFNRKINGLVPSYKKLFVFTEWLRYLQMRLVILGQVYHPINRLVASDEGIDHDTDLYIDYTTRKKRSADSFRVSSGTVNQQWMVKLKEAVTNIVDTNHRLGTSQDCTRSIEFEPSLTPHRSYLQTFLQAYNKDKKIHVPNFMHEDHSDRTVSPFVDPSDLKHLLQANHNILLATKKVKSTVDCFTFTDFVRNVPEREDLFMYAESCSETEWNPSEKRSHPMENHEYLLNKILIRNEIEKEKTELILSEEKQYLSEPEESFTTAESSPFFSEELFSQDSMIEPNQSAAAAANQSIPSSITLLTPNYDFWVRNFSHCEAESMEQFDERIAPHFPKNFRLLLEECARVVENRPQSLYREVVMIENYFFYAVQPVERFVVPGEVRPEDVQYEGSNTDTNMRRRVSDTRKYY